MLAVYIDFTLLMRLPFQQRIYSRQRVAKLGSGCLVHVGVVVE